jgi:hypothetical protein
MEVEQPTQNFGTPILKNGSFAKIDYMEQKCHKKGTKMIQNCDENVTVSW